MNCFRIKRLELSQVKKEDDSGLYNLIQIAEWKSSFYRFQDSLLLSFQSMAPVDKFYESPRKQK